MKTLTQHLVHYAEYHRDARNIYSHFIGIPLIVVAVAGLLGRLPLAGGITLAHLVVALLIGFYLTLNVGLGLCMACAMWAALYAGLALAASGSGLMASLALFALGWVIQFIGHGFEGRKPAFFDDVMGLVIGPLFVVDEWLFMFGWYSGLKASVEQQAGPVRSLRN